jgi:hypothetical protein
MIWSMVGKAGMVVPMVFGARCPPPDASLLAEDPGHLAALEPDGQLPGVRRLDGVSLALRIDASLEARAQPPLRLRPDLHRRPPGTLPTGAASRSGRRFGAARAVSPAWASGIAPHAL